MSDLRNAAEQALEALEFMADEWGFTNKANRPERWQAIDALRAALEQPEPPPEAQTEAEKIAYCAGWWAAMEKMREPVPMRAPKENDRVICIEDESLGTVWWTDAAGGPYIKFDDGSYGQWMLHEFGKLFRYAALEQPQRHVSYVCPQCHWSLEQPEQPYAAQARRVEQETHGRMRINPVTGNVSIGTPTEQPEQEPVAYLYHDASTPQHAHPWLHSTMLVLAADRRPSLRGETPLYTHPPRRRWRGLTDTERAAVQYESFKRGLSPLEFMELHEAALKERNHD